MFGDPNLIIIGSVSKGGVTTLVRRLQAQTQFPVLYSGGFMRIEALKAGFILPQFRHDPTNLDGADLLSFRIHCKQTGRDIDDEIDLFLHTGMLNAVLKNKPMIADSKLGYRLFRTKFYLDLLARINGADHGDEDILEEIRQRMIASSRAIWLYAPVRVRAQRSLLKANPEGYTDQQLENEIAYLMKRQVEDADTWNQLYGVDDYPVLDSLPSPLFGTAVSTEGTPEETLALVNLALDLQGIK